MNLVRAPVEQEDWLPPWCPTPPLSLGLVPEDMAWEEGLSFSRVRNGDTPPASPRNWVGDVL